MKFAGIVLLMLACAGLHAESRKSDTFTNPLLPVGPDPWVEYKDGVYYYMNTTVTNLTLWKTRSMTDLKSAEKKVVWTPPASGPYSHDIWAPEIHFLDGKWYIYFAADAGANQTHRVWVIENASADPFQGEWTLKGKVADSTDKWAIDASVFEDQGKLYLIWSGWEGDENGIQSIYIARLKSPWTVESERTRISTPQYPWEKVGDLNPKRKIPGDPEHIDVNEGPEILKHESKIFLIYSASGCWTDNYSLGMLTADSGTDLLNPASWKKSATPVFHQSPEAHVYATGHNSFFKSPDGKEDWLLYHANSKPDQGCGWHRAPRAQPFTWNSDGTPNFGTPVPAGKPLQRPSGEPAKNYVGNGAPARPQLNPLTVSLRLGPVGIEAAFGSNARGLADFFGHFERGVTKRSSVRNDRAGSQRELQSVFLSIEVKHYLARCHGGRTSEKFVRDIIGPNRRSRRVLFRCLRDLR